VEKPEPKQALAIDIGLDEGDTLREKKLKRFEELKRRKLEEMEQRRRDKSLNDKGGISPNQSKSPIRGSRSPWRVDAKRVLRKGEDLGSEEEKLVHLSQSKFEALKEQQPLAAHVPSHLLKRQQMKQDQTPTQQATPKLTPNVLAAKKGFTKNSNKKIIKNALLVCLAGESNKAEREQVLKVLEESEFPYYLILFRGNLGRQDFRALYCHNGSLTIFKLHGPPSVPDVLEDRMVEKFFRYESSSKAFKEIEGIKTFTLTTDAVTIKQAHVQRKQ